jgi:hypothetical protein
MRPLRPPRSVLTLHNAHRSYRRTPRSAGISFSQLSVALGAVLLALAVLASCSNSFLRNATEAGYETLTEAPTVTPTASR